MKLPEFLWTILPLSSLLLLNSVLVLYPLSQLIFPFDSIKNFPRLLFSTHSVGSFKDRYPFVLSAPLFSPPFIRRSISLSFSFRPFSLSLDLLFTWFVVDYIWKSLPWSNRMQNLVVWHKGKRRKSGCVKICLDEGERGKILSDRELRWQESELREWASWMRKRTEGKKLNGTQNWSAAGLSRGPSLPLSLSFLYSVYSFTITANFFHFDKNTADRPKVPFIPLFSATLLKWRGTNKTDQLETQNEKIILSLYLNQLDLIPKPRF